MKIDWTTLGVTVTAFLAFAGIAGVGLVTLYFKIQKAIWEGQTELAALKQKASDNAGRLDRQGARVSSLEVALPAVAAPVAPTTFPVALPTTFPAPPFTHAGTGSLPATPIAPTVTNDTSSSSNQAMTDACGNDWSST